MDAEMAFLMANQALVMPGKLVYDPFVGTGSILVAAAHFGAMTMVCILLPFSFMLICFPSATCLSNFKQKPICFLY
jgi:tRNA (guanine10-N2)-methyltransferase